MKNTKKSPVKKVEIKKENPKNLFIDENTERFGAPKIYQYSQVEK